MSKFLCAGKKITFDMQFLYRGRKPLKYLENDNLTELVIQLKLSLLNNVYPGNLFHYMIGN